MGWGSAAGAFSEVRSGRRGSNPARRRRPEISSGASLRLLPLRRLPSSSDPMATRRRCMTLWPSLARVRPVTATFAPDAAILALSEHDLQQGRLAPGSQSTDALGPGLALGEVDAVQKLLDIFAAGTPRHLDHVGLFDPVAGMSQALGQFAVVGEQQQPFAGLIESAHGEQALPHVEHQVDGPWSTRRVVVGAQVALGLVEQPVGELLGGRRLPVNGDLLAGPDPRAWIGHDLAIEANVALLDQFIAAAARAEAAGGQVFVQTFGEIGGHGFSLSDGANLLAKALPDSLSCGGRNTMSPRSGKEARIVRIWLGPRAPTLNHSSPHLRRLRLP